MAGVVRIGESANPRAPTHCGQRHDAMIQHGATAEKDVTPVGVGVTELVTPVSVETHTVTTDPPKPGLRILG
jgi:hypothetical protein